MKLSNLARPPIQASEVQAATTAICVNHRGLIRVTGDVEGKVFLCPIGKEYWRYAKGSLGINAPLPYVREAVL
jgi:hypothetical protein